MSWEIGIVGHENVCPKQITANPFNHRTHPERQRRVVRSSIEELKFIKSVLINKTTGHLIDGHERVQEALDEIEALEQLGESTDHVLVPVEYVEMDEEQERLALAVLDSSSEMAGLDGLRLQELLKDLHSNDDNLNELLKRMESQIEVNIEDISGLFEDEGQRPKSKRRLSLEFKEADYRRVMDELKRRGGTPEELVMEWLFD